MELKAVRAHLQGPISSIKTPFNKDFQVDHDALHQQVQTLIARGSKTALLTAGDSHLLSLVDAELVAVTRTVCAAAKGKAMIVVADRGHTTGHAVEFARFAHSAGADIVMTLPPHWSAGSTAQNLADHYAAVAAELPTMIVSNIFAQRATTFALETVQRTLDNERIVAIKDDLGGEFARRLCLLAHEQMAIFAGGRKENHLNMWPYGCDGYMSTFQAFRPDLAQKYWRAVEEKDLDTMRALVQLEMDFFAYLAQCVGGWNAGMHGVLELAGLGSRWRRPPNYSLNDREMEALANFLQEKDLNPAT
jgi:dihydrodipicolinate synthase/N-acetylneuraminate lyase